MRKAVFSGKLYENEFDKLNKQIEDCFKKGPGDLPISSRDKKVRGVIVPCCNYAVSGSIAAWAYKEIAESKFPELYVLLGSCHGSRGYGYLSLDDFESPFGVVRNAKLYSRNDHVVIDEKIHNQSRDIEIQLPFLQFVSRDKLSKLRIMPLLLGDLSFDKAVSIGRAIKSIDKDFVVIAGCNLNMYGEKYGNVPFKYNVLDEIRSLDFKGIELIKSFSVEDFWKFADKFNLKCKSVVTVFLEALKSDDKNKIRLLGYGTSGDVTNDYNNFASFASLLFERFK